MPESVADSIGFLLMGMLAGYFCGYVSLKLLEYERRNKTKKEIL